MISTRLTRLAVAAIVATATIGLTADERGADGQPMPERSDGTIEVTRCEVKFFRRAELATDRPGIIAEMPFDEGDAISQGDLVVRLRDEVEQANLKLATERASSTAAVEIAKKEYEAAAVELKSYEEGDALYRERYPNASNPLNSATKTEQLRITKEAKAIAIVKAEQEVSLNQRARDQAQAEVDSLRIHSKQAGVVVRVRKREGEAVQQGEAIIEVVDPSIARVEGKVPVGEARRIKVGMPVEVHLDFERENLPIENEVFIGRIGFVDVSASPSLNEVRVWAEIENRDGILLDNLPARMTIDVGE